MSGEEIKWEEPDATVAGKGARGVWVRRLAPLRDRPGEWANLGRRNANLANRINSGEPYGIEPGEYEATMRDTDEKTRKGTLYVRYIGGAL